MLYKTQISLTEWFQRMGLANADAHRKEDNDKRERLAVLNDLFGLPFDRPTQFPAVEIVIPSPAFAEFLETRGHELCALRLIPHDSAMPKLRTRGASIRDSLAWFADQKIDATKYKADFVPHDALNTWSTIFVVNQRGVFGQIIAAGHNQLTQGFYEDVVPRTFSWNFKDWSIEPVDDSAVEYLKSLISMLYVSNVGIQQKIQKDLEGEFVNNYLCGYFETTDSKEFGTWFKDYNRLLGKMYSDEMSPIAQASRLPSSLHGNIGSRGTATGRARVIRAVDLANSDIEPGDILVTDVTTPDFLPLMQKAGAVVTAWGGILSHAAIVCRELGKPCLTNVKGLLDEVKDGDLVEVDGEAGEIRVMR